MPILHYDEVALQRDPNLDTLNHTWTHSQRYKTAEGPRIFELMASRAGVAALVGAAVAAPSKPVVVAVEPLIEAMIGDAAFTDTNKQNIGRIAKAILVELGAEHIRPGVPVTVTSRFTKGSTYQFPEYERRPMKR